MFHVLMFPCVHGIMCACFHVSMMKFHVSMFPYSNVFMFSCAHVVTCSCSHASIFICSRFNVCMFPHIHVSMFPCCHVPMSSCCHVHIFPMTFSCCMIPCFHAHRTLSHGTCKHENMKCFYVPRYVLYVICYDYVSVYVLCGMWYVSCVICYMLHVMRYALCGICYVFTC